MPDTTKHTGFEPQVHGFKFPNAFDFDPAIFGATDLELWEFGLCGGMCSAALNRFIDKEPIPSQTTPPQQVCPELQLFYELFGRQALTLYPDNWARIIAAQITGDADIPQYRGFPPTIVRWDPGLARKTVEEEWPIVRGSISAGRPMIITLIRVRGLTNPTENHQVLATGFTHNRFTKKVQIQIYDPNHPEENHQIDMSFNDPSNSINGVHSDGSTVRGFLAIEDPTAPPLEDTSEETSEGDSGETVEFTDEQIEEVAQETQWWPSRPLGAGTGTPYRSAKPELPSDVSASYQRFVQTAWFRRRRYGRRYRPPPVHRPRS